MFAGSSLSPNLRIGTISAFSQGGGRLLKEKELLIRLVNKTTMGAITGDLSFRMFAFTLSQLGALLDGKLVIIVCTSPNCFDKGCEQIHTDEFSLCLEC